MNVAVTSPQPFDDPAGTWNRRFSESGYLFGTEPNGWLHDHADLLEAGQRVLCVANLARTPQAVELDLSRHEGRVPMEISGRAAFPPVGRLPYLLTLPGHGFYAFEHKSDHGPFGHVTQGDVIDLLAPSADKLTDAFVVIMKVLFVWCYHLHANNLEASTLKASDDLA